jgi:WD40 repeat protein
MSVIQPSMKDGKKPTASQREPVKTFEGHERPITSIATFQDGKRIATGSYDKTVRIWRLEDGKEMRKWVMKKHVTAIAILRDGMQVVSAVGDVETFSEADWDKTVYWQLWVHDTGTGKVVAGPLDGHTNLVLALDISPDGGILASGSFDCTVILWNTTTWQRNDDPLKLALLLANIYKYGTWNGGNVLFNSRVTPNSTAVGTTRSPGLTMAAVSSQQVMTMTM